MIILGDCLVEMAKMEPNSIDSVVCDPPYGLAFMGKKWDYDVPSIETWEEALRVLKPGGHLLSFGGTRTYHRLASAIEDAGFEIRDQLQWLFGSGFPKSLDVSKAIDKAAGVEGEIIGKNPAFRERQLEHDTDWETAMRPEFKRGPSTDAAKQWAGWGTALKPANEPIVLARKPLSEKTVAANVLRWNTGGLNIDGCRIGTSGGGGNGLGSYLHGSHNGQGGQIPGLKHSEPTVPQGRFPSNLLLDETAAEMLDGQSGNRPSAGKYKDSTLSKGMGDPNSMFGAGSNPEKNGRPTDYSGENGGASRFFYVAKASKRERNEGLEDKSNGHPTVKPITLMRYLCRLITPPNGIVLDPFCGSGSTGVAALKEGFRFIGIEREAEYVEIARRRLNG